MIDLRPPQILCFTDEWPRDETTAQEDRHPGLAARPRRALASHRPGSGMTTKMAYRPGAVVCISATPIATLRL